MWISVFFGGIWQFIRRIFSWKNKTPFWRVIWAVMTVCVLTFTSILVYIFCEELKDRKETIEYYQKMEIGKDFAFYNKGKGKGYIIDKKTGKKIHKGIDWIARPADGDSLIVFARNGKRGFLSSKTGNIVIPAKYDAAWCFNDGVAGVCEGDSVFFIDHYDTPINKRRYKRESGKVYSYHGKYASIGTPGMLTLVDRNGDIILSDSFDDLIPVANEMWISSLHGKKGVINAEGDPIIPNEYKDVYVYPEGGIVVMSEDNSKKRMDYNGVITDSFVYENTFTLEYESDELDKEGQRIRKPAKLATYCNNNHYGLIDSDGKPVTPPVYSVIYAYSANLFECRIDNFGEYLMLNESGEKVIN